MLYSYPTLEQISHALTDVGASCNEKSQRQEVHYVELISQAQKHSRSHELWTVKKIFKMIN